MSRRLVGMVLLVLASLALGLAGAEVFFRLFLETVPPMALSAFNASAAHAVFLLYGFVLGLAFCGWALLAILASRFFVGR